MSLIGLVYNSGKRNDATQWAYTLATVGLSMVSGSFEDGGVVHTDTDALWSEALGKCYVWSGVLPVVVPPGSTPTPTAMGWREVGATLGVGVYVQVGDVLVHEGTLGRVLGASGTVAQINAHVITYTDSTVAYLVDIVQGVDKLESWGVSPSNAAALNTQLFQAAINYCSGGSVSTNPVTVADVYALSARHVLTVSTGFKTHPVRTYPTTTIQSPLGLSGVNSTISINFVVDTPTKGCFSFDARELVGHTGQYFYGGTFIGISSIVTGLGSCANFVHATHTVGLCIKQCRHLGAEFFMELHDGWNCLLENNISNTTCGGIRTYRCTLGQVIGGYYNALAPQSNAIGFDYVLASAIEGSNRDISTKSVYQYSRGIHMLSSNLSFVGCAFEHWDIAHAQYGGGIDKLTSCYFEGIKQVVYAITAVSGCFRPMTVNVLSFNSCRLLECNNISGGAADEVVVDIRGLSVNTSRLGQLGYSVYAGGKSRVLADKLSLRLLPFAFVGVYGTATQTPIYIDTLDTPTLYVSSTGTNTASGTEGNPTGDLYSALVVASLFTHPKGVTVQVAGTVPYSTTNKTSVDVTVPVTIQGGVLDFSNASARLSCIIGDTVSLYDCTLQVAPTGVNRSNRNVFVPKGTAVYTLRNVQLVLNSAFLLGDYTGTTKAVTLRMENVTQTGVGGGIVRSVPAVNEQILFTYIKQGCTITGPETGTNIVPHGVLSL